MTDTADPHPLLQPPAEAGMRALHGYWRGLCRGSALPRRAEIDPRRIATVLPDTFILERIAPGLARFRVAGTRVSALMGMDVRGMPVSCLIAPAARAGFADALVRLFEEPAMLRLRLRSDGGLGRPALAGRMLLLPLCSDLGDVSRALGCLVAEGDVGHTPRRFAVEALTAAPVGGPVAAPAAGAAAPARPALPGERPWLRLVAREGALVPA